MKDDLLKKFKIAIQTGKYWDLPELSPYQQVKYELSVTEDDIILRRFYLVVPKSLHKLLP